ncbi:MAG: LysM domain [Solirubrobacteraceae bacterium]|nr:LysM domain [Solirubrobacteraceae bacterium]
MGAVIAARMLSLTMQDIDHQHYASPALLALLTIRDADTPTPIASHAGMSVDRLLELNPTLDPRSMRPGQKLTLAR